jgi:hypothetical protein
MFWYAALGEARPQRSIVGEEMEHAGGNVIPVKKQGNTTVWWYGGTVVRWYGGTVVRWYGGTVVRWAAVCGEYPIIFF